jgi:hypothetical protein
MKVFTFSSHHIELSKKGKLDSNELMYEETKPEASPVNDMICHESMPKPHRRPDVLTHTRKKGKRRRKKKRREKGKRIVQELICHESMPKPHRRPDVVTLPQLVNNKLYTEPVDSVAREQLFFETATRIVQDLMCQDSLYV